MATNLPDLESWTPEVDEAVRAAFAVIDGSTQGARRIDVEKIGEDWRREGWRETYGSWEAYLSAEHGIHPRIPPRACDDRRHVYFILADNGLIKIGVAASPQRRVANLSTGSPVPLRLLAVIRGVGGSRERELHERFAAARSHGEWFHPTAELTAYIREHGSFE